MTKAILSLIAAVSENNVIGRDNALPWNLPNDLRYFREKTKGHPVIMGWKNYQSIGRPLPHRKNIVISMRPEKIEGCEVVSSLDEALIHAQKDTDGEIFIIGGGQTYREALPLADRVYLTRVHAVIDGDITFPDFPTDEWYEVSREPHGTDEQHAFPYTFLVYERREP